MPYGDGVILLHGLGRSPSSMEPMGHRPKRPGRMVLLGTPSSGSEVADRLVDLEPYRRIFGPAGAELTTNHPAHEVLLGAVNYPLGIIAGTRSLDPLGWLLLPKPNDGKVTVARTRCRARPT